MGLNIRRSIKVSKNTRLNLSKSGIGVSTGIKGARVSIGPRGVRRTLGIPGTGIYATKQTSYRRMRKQQSSINTKHSAEWYVFAIIAGILVGAAIMLPALTITLFGVIGIAFIGYLVIHFIRGFRAR